MVDLVEMERRLLLMLRCPRCGGSLSAESAGSVPEQVACRRCGATYRRVSGIWRMLTPEQQARYSSFISSYAALREREGWVRDASYYLSLPNVPPGDPAEFIWRIRRRSLAALERIIGPGQGRWALDLGAGSGWLSRHLAKRGYNTVAVDLNVEGADGLEGASVYMEHDHIWLGRVQASMDDLPFADASFALCAISAALHYAPCEETLREVYRVLQPGGQLLITDSPIFKDPEAGLVMASEQRARAGALLGYDPAALPGGEGYLVEEQLIASMWSAGFRVRLVTTEGLPAQARRVARRLVRPGSRDHARFPVVVGLKW
jgi:SAM-dependent methyltransferase/ribosomal protein S27AE